MYFLHLSYAYTITCFGSIQNGEREKKMIGHYWKKSDVPLAWHKLDVNPVVNVKTRKCAPTVYRK